MTAQFRSRAVWLWILGLVFQTSACEKENLPGQKRFSIDEIGLSFPQTPGWQKDRSVRMEDPAKGGIALRLIRESSVPMAPRITVEIQAIGATATRLETLLNQNLRQMGSMENTNQIRIIQVDQKSLQIGSQPAYRVRHEYVLGQQAQQVAITQVSIFLIRDGRGVTITAAGRTELYHPVADSVEAVLSDIRTFETGVKSSRPSVPSNSGTQPIDLGKVGGGK